MALPLGDTLIGYPDGETRGQATVLHRELRPDGRAVVLLDATPFHPVDPTWPDQGPDLGVLVTSADDGPVPVPVPVLDCRIAASDGAELPLGERLPVRLGTEGWAFVVAHVVDGAAPIAEGDRVAAAVDEEHRRALSLGHTSCHLASLALNRALAGFWSKAVAPDALGSPDFDHTAIVTSSIRPHGSIDEYRLGKSLRKRGFDSARLAAELVAVAEAANGTLAGWVASDAGVRIRRDDRALSTRRFWECELPEGLASIACGGTHAEHLGELGTVRVSLELHDDGAALRMITTETA
ncbi:metal-dependent hydrolase [Herbiconiux sp. CPCC 205716]|uniref:Metal-dependent hydrolase n=1 Tax=Herbiconiux gentiana TaxID=2970912 RepID=A0ABT2GJH9_9MICO|nr:metal-dependent hydrolase [Herbiconiux gentiana]MCS5716380.1 metal-dependent hydrolase [Herbiconiux gentiana]